MEPLSGAAPWETRTGGVYHHGDRGRGEDGEGSLGGEPLHHPGGLEGGVQGGEVLVLGDQCRHALGVGDHSGLLGLLGGPGVLGDQVGVGAAEVGHGPGHGGAVREVVVETTDGAGNIAELLLSLGQQQGVQGLKYREMSKT